MKPNNSQSPLTFPCHFPVKVMGKNTKQFIQELQEVCLKHFPNLEKECTLTYSNNNNYVSISVTVYAENKQQLDALYREITQHPDVKMAL